MAAADAGIGQPGWKAAAWRILRVGIGLALLYFSAREIRWATLWDGLRNVHWAWMGLAWLSVLASTALKVLRWKQLYGLCGADVQPGSWTLARAFVLGQAANVVLPFRGGDVARVGWAGLERGNRVERTALAAVTVAVEKYLDLLALLVLVVVLGPLLPLDAVERFRGWLLPFGLVASAALIALAWTGPYLWRWLEPALEQCNWRWSRRITEWIDRTFPPNNLRNLRNPRTWFLPVVCTLAVWAMMLLTNLLVLRGLDLPADWRAGGLVLALVYLGVAPALMPGNLGPFYFFAMLGLAPFGIEASQRAAFAVLLHAVVTLTPVALAAILLAAGWLGKANAR